MTRCLKICCFILLFAAAYGARAEDVPIPPLFQERAAKACEIARVRYRREASNVEAAWQMGRAAFDCAMYATHDSDRRAAAEEGIRACRQALVDDPNSAWGHYYLGCNLGQLAAASGIGALHMLHDMEDEWTIAARLDEAMDYAGPDRCLGLLYRDAPGRPISIGSRGKAIQYLTRAVALSTNYPENRIALAEAYLKWNDTASARRIAADLPEVMKQGHKTFSGPAWGFSWVDWDRRMAAIRVRLAEVSRPRPPHTTH